MKSTAFAAIAAAPFAAKALFAQIAMDGNMLDFAKDVGYAGLVFYLIAYSMPRQSKSHAEERQRWQEKEDARETRTEATIQKIVNDHKEASNRGHEAAAKLADRIEQMEKRIQNS